MKWVWMFVKASLLLWVPFLVDVWWQQADELWQQLALMWALIGLVAGFALLQVRRD